MSYSYNDAKREEPSMIAKALRLHSMRARSVAPLPAPPTASVDQVNEYKARLREALEKRSGSLTSEQRTDVLVA